MSLTLFSNCAAILVFLSFYSLIHVTLEWLEFSLLDAPSPRRVISSVLLLLLLCTVPCATTKRACFKTYISQYINSNFFKFWPVSDIS